MLVCGIVLYGMKSTNVQNLSVHTAYQGNNVLLLAMPCGVAVLHGQFMLLYTRANSIGIGQGLMGPRIT